MNPIWKRRFPFAIAVLGLLFLGAGAFWWVRGRNSPPIPPAGGEAFANLSPLATPFYLQRDSRWKDERIGGSGETLGKVGCTVSSLAMALHGYQFEFTPKTLNDALKATNGYTRRGWLKWDAVSQLTAGKVSVMILERPSHADLDAALKARQPVLAKVFISRVIPHWVLIVGKTGKEYLIRDPLGDGKSLTPLSTYESDIYGVRIVRRNLLAP